MMMGEYDYEDLFKDSYLPYTSRIVFVIFVLLSSIVLINLMIGLAVYDIQALVKEVRSPRVYSKFLILRSRNAGSLLTIRS